jgi:hypothetical protein
MSQMRLVLMPFRSGLLVRAGVRSTFLPVVALLAGCVSTPGPRLDVWGAAQNCHFAHVTKSDFATALRRVFDASRPSAYGLHPE